MTLEARPAYLPTMRHLFALALALTACAADPVLLPDSGPCSSACGAGTVCSGGACVAVDGGSPVDVGEDRPAVVDLGSPVDAGASVDVGAMDTGADAGRDVSAVDTYGACLANGIRECDGRNIMTQIGEVDGGRTYHCGGCGITCEPGEFCLRCRCQR